MYFLVGSSGKKALMFPQDGDDNHLESGREYPIPPKGVMEFDNNPGAERLVLALSKTPIEGGKALELSGANLSLEMLTGKPSKLGEYSVSTGGSDGLVYVSNPNAEKPTIIEINLTRKSNRRLRCCSQWRWRWWT